ncbi:hypothetical protein ACOSQ2_014162 [Xanthoceras sorbifolium]
MHPASANFAQQPQQSAQANFAQQQHSAYFASTEVVNDPTWYADSGATNHVTSDLNNLSLSSKYKGTDKLTLGNGNQLSILNVGKSTCLSHSNPVKHTALNQMLHVPSISKNLLSVSRLTKDNNLIAEFCGDHYVFKDKMQASL